MKRTIASLLSAISVFAIASPVFASPNLTTRNSQPRISRRALKRAAHYAYQTRQKWDSTYARQRYAAVISNVMASLPQSLAVTGAGRTHSDLLKVHRPSPRMVNNWVLSDHCSVNSRRCQER